MLLQHAVTTPCTDHGASYWMSDFVLWGSLVVMPALFLVVMGWAGMKAQGFLLAGFAVGGAVGGASGSIVGAVCIDLVRSRGCYRWV